MIPWDSIKIYPGPGVLRRFWEKIHVKPGECWDWIGAIISNGYGSFWPTSAKSVLVHRYMFYLVYGEIPDEYCVLHTCDNRACINPDHLWLGTYTDNNRDAVAKGRHRGPSGETHPKAKLTIADVRLIRRLEGKVSARELAEDFGINRSGIYKIWKGETWRGNI